MRIYEPKKILVPIDLSEISLGVLQAGVDIGNKWEAEVQVLHVARESEHVPSFNVPAVAVASYADMSKSKLREDARLKLEGQLESMMKKVGGGPKTSCLLLWGDPAKDIVSIAENGDYDLIVMATHGRRGLDRLVGGSVTEEVIRRATCPVLAIRIKGDQELMVRAKAEQEAAK